MKDKENTLEFDTKSALENDSKADGVKNEEPKQYKALTKRERQKMIKKSRKLKNKQNNSKVKKEKEPKPKIKLKSQERKVLSYEDLPLDDSGRSRFQMSPSFANAKKAITRVVVILVVLSLAVLIFANRDSLTFSNIKNWVQYGIFNMNSEEQFPRSTDGDVIYDGNFTRIDKNLVFASDTRFMTVNNYGRTIYSIQQNYTSPVLVTAADCDLSLVYNLGATSFSINTLDSTIYTSEAPDDILVADISKSGTYALVTQKDGYLSKLYVYSKDHEQIYAYSFADYYITSVSLDSSGDRAVLSGFSAHEGSQISAVYLLDFDEEQPVVFQEFNDNAVYYVDHLNDKFACIIGENSAYTLNLRTKQFNTFDYSGKSLTAFTVNTDTNTFAISLSRSGDGRKCDILNFTSSGKLKSTISTELNISSISTYKNRVAVLSDDIVYLYSKDGNLISQTDAGLEPHCVVLYSKKDAFILGVSEIRRLDL